MIPKHIIEKAIAGGWKLPSSPFSVEAQRWERSLYAPEVATRYPELAITDPDFWMALGKEMGWGVLRCINCEKTAVPVRKNENDPEYWADCCPRKRLDYGKSWELYAVDFVRLILRKAPPQEITNFWNSL